MKTMFILRFSLIVCLIICVLNGLRSQSNQWTWMKGDSITYSFGIYGTKGVSSPLNKPGGRTSGSSWRDNSGNFWLFGGNGLSAGNYGDLNDLWRYSTISNEWVWVKGDSLTANKGVYNSPFKADNKPGSRIHAMTWTDATGNLWLFGGSTLDANNNQESFNDLWRYNIALNEWTFMKGDSVLYINGSYGTKGVSSPANKPGSREGCASWSDAAGNLWLFGGEGFGSNGVGSMNDLWMFNIASNQWTWIGGDSTVNAYAIYGNKNITSFTNKPGARISGTSWTDLTGNLWLLGGYGYTQSGIGFLNDLWKYSPSGNTWTWVKGDSIINSKAVYGAKGISSSGNKPGSRTQMVNWRDISGNLWLFGGGGYLTNANGSLNDLWKYNIASNEWTWVKGDSVSNRLSIYGTQLIPATGNKPGGRSGANSWTDISGNFWLFGGYGFSTSGSGYFNDAWRFKPDSAALPVHLISFSGKMQNEKSRLEWKVETEQNFDRYIIERSFDGDRFIKIGMVKADSKYLYSFYDHTENFKTSVLYYRLKLTDKDGSFSYSSIIMLKKGEASRFIVYPNPASDYFQLKISEELYGTANIKITDAQGRVLLAKTIDLNSPNLKISTNSLKAGVYTIKIINDSEEFKQPFILIK